MRQVLIIALWITLAMRAHADTAQEIKRINAALAKLRHVTGGFEQISAQGTPLTGQFFMSRPGRVRFNYDPPAEQIIIARGETIFIRDIVGEQPDQFPKSATPIGLFLDAEIALAGSAYTQEIKVEDEVVSLHLADPDGDMPGALALYFRRSDYLLLGWQLRDAQNQTVQVRLRNLAFHAQLPDELFEFTDAEAGR